LSVPCKCFSRLNEKVDTDENCFGDTNPFQTFCEILKSMDNLENLEIEFLNYDLDQRVLPILKNLLEENKSIQSLLFIDFPCLGFPAFKLKELNFVSANSFGSQYDTEFYQSLSKVQVEKLSLSTFLLPTKDSFSFLAKDLFIKEFCVYKQLNDIGNLFTWIGSFIEQNETMEKLSMIGFKVSSEDLLNFTNSLRKNKKIHFLDISGTREFKEDDLQVSDDSSMKIFIESMSQNKQISTLDLTQCIQHLKVEYLVNLLKENDSITKLNLSSFIFISNER
jgi:hypothetical protein